MVGFDDAEVIEERALEAALRDDAQATARRIEQLDVAARGARELDRGVEDGLQAGTLLGVCRGAEVGDLQQPRQRGQFIVGSVCDGNLPDWFCLLPADLQAPSRAEAGVTVRRMIGTLRRAAKPGRSAAARASGQASRWRTSPRPKVGRAPVPALALCDRAPVRIGQPLPRATACCSTATAASASTGPSTCTGRVAPASTCAHEIGSWSPPNSRFMTSFDAA